MTVDQMNNNSVLRLLSFMLFGIAVIFYVGWGIAYGDWFDIGLYSITVVLGAFGLTGFFLFNQKIKEGIED